MNIPLLPTQNMCIKLMYIHICMYNCADGIPSDGIPIEEVVTVSIGLTVVYVILASVGIVFAIICLTFTFIFRERRYSAIACFIYIECNQSNCMQVNSSVQP